MQESLRDRRRFVEREVMNRVHPAAFKPVLKFDDITWSVPV